MGRFDTRFTSLNPEVSSIRQDQVGREFETEFINACTQWAKNLTRDSIEVANITHSIDDTDHGQDAKIIKYDLDGEEVLNLYIDPTLNFTGKLSTSPFVASTDVLLDIYPVKLGIRTGNKHNGFKEFPFPTIAIGVDVSPSQFRDMDSRILQRELLIAMPKIMDKVIDVYQDYNTLDPEKRKLLPARPLTTNAFYNIVVNDPKSSPALKKHIDMLRQIKEQEKITPAKIQERKRLAKSLQPFEPFPDDIDPEYFR